MHTEAIFAWEQRKLGDIGKARSGVGFPDAEQGGVTGIPFFKVSDMNLDGNENEMTVANNYVTAEQIAVHRWSPITELPAIFFAKVGAAVMLNRKRLCRFPFLLDNNTMAYSLSSTKWDADFAKALFGTVDLTSLVQVGALPSYNARDGNISAEPFRARANWRFFQAARHPYHPSPAEVFLSYIYI